MSRLLVIFFIIIPAFLYSQSAIEYNRLGQKKMDENDIYSSLEYYTKSIEINPDYHQSLFGIARAYFRLSEYDASLVYIEQAKQLSKNNLEYRNLEGRTKVGLGQMEEAFAIFSEILIVEPNNISARLGIAEIDLIENRFTEAELLYRESLLISPESKRALLSLLLLYDSRGDYIKGDGILEILNSYYSYIPEIKMAAAEHYYRSGQHLKAEESGLALLSLDPDFNAVKPLMAKIFLEKGDAGKAVSFLEEELGSNRNNLELRFLLAIAYRNIGRITESLHNFDFILRNAPYDEITRLAAEDVAISNSVAAKIKEYARYHFNEGRRYDKLFRYDRALAEFRRGLKINPDSIEGRLAYGEIFEKRGFTAKYIDILNLLEWNGFKDPDFLNKKKQIEHLKEDNVAENWNVAQFDLLKNQYLLDIYVKKPDIQPYHNMSEIIIAGYFDYILDKFDRLKQNRTPLIIKEDTEAYKYSHNSDSEYYLIIEYSESMRIFTMDISVYLSRTGVLMEQFSVLRAGNNKITDAITICGESIYNFFPYKGRIISINDDKALINLGKLDGLEIDDKFLIVRNNKARVISESPWYEVSDEDKLGIFIVERTDEGVSEGVIQNPGFFRLSNPGDEIYIIPGDQEILLKPDYGYNQNLKRELLKLY